MPPSPTLAARNARILAGHAAGATVIELALAEEVDTAVVRRVLLAAGIDPGLTRMPSSAPAAIAEALGCTRWRLYGLLREEGVLRTMGWLGGQENWRRRSIA